MTICGRECGVPVAGVGGIRVTSGGKKPEKRRCGAEGVVCIVVHSNLEIGDTE
jgi:hypothetical protein